MSSPVSYVEVLSHLLAFFSGVNWSTRDEQRVEEMVSQANTRLEPLVKSSFLHTVVPLDVASRVVSTHQKTRYSTIKVMYIPP